MKFDLQIKHPEWLQVSKPQDSIRLFLSGKLPQNIAGWMIVVGLKHPLRAVYGSDFRAAWALLIDSLADKIKARIWEPVEKLSYWIPFCYAHVMTFIEGNLKRYPDWGRRESPEPTVCECGWRGMRRWTTHTYHDEGTGEDVEPVDECPRCGNDV